MSGSSLDYRDGEEATLPESLSSLNGEGSLERDPPGYLFGRGRIVQLSLVGTG